MTSMVEFEVGDQAVCPNCDERVVLDRAGKWVVLGGGYGGDTCTVNTGTAKGMLVPHGNFVDMMVRGIPEVLVCEAGRIRLYEADEATLLAAAAYLREMSWGPK